RDQRPIASNKIAMTANATRDWGLDLATRTCGGFVLCRVAVAGASRAASAVAFAIVSSSMTGAVVALHRCAIASAIVRAAYSSVLTSCGQKASALSEKAS